MQPSLDLLPLLSLLLPLTSAANPTLRIHNTRTTPICIHIETSTGSFPTTTVCPGGLPGISVPALHTSIFSPSASWNGALTPIITYPSSGHVGGTRFEINFSSPNDGTSTWYDADMEMGISAATLGPTSHQPLINGQKSSLAGEADPLAKATAAFAHLSANEKQALLAQSGNYIQADATRQRVTRVWNDKQAPQAVRVFLQLKAGFMAYLGPGSVEGGKREGGVQGQMVQAQDSKSWVVGSRDMTLNVF
ncbi:MAG: hypothetical protein Q9220_004687 [cf. Caloplaca sp. 1 TL-2023]